MSRLFTISIITLFLVLAHHRCCAQSYQQFNHLKSQDGLLTNIVVDIVQDREGYMWIASAQGLQRFDGLTFTNYDHDPSLPDATISRLFLDNTGTLWIQYDHSIFKYDRPSGSFTRIVVADDRGHRYQNLFQDFDGRLWLTIENAPLHVLEPGKNAFGLSGSMGLQNDRIRYIQQERGSGKFWVSTDDQIFVCDKSGGNCKSFLLDSALLRSSENEQIRLLNAFSIDRQDQAWLSFQTSDGKSFIIHGDLAKEKWETWPADGNVSRFFTTRSKVTWAAGSDLEWFTGERWSDANAFSEMPFDFEKVADSVYCITEDRDGAMWVGTSNGVYVFIPQFDKFQYYLADKLDQPRAIVPYGAASMMIVDQRNHSVQVDDKLTSRWIKADTHQSEPLEFYADHQRKLWMLQGQSLKEVNGKKRAHVPVDSVAALLPSTAIADSWWIVRENGEVIKWNAGIQSVEKTGSVNRNSTYGAKLLPEEESNRIWIIGLHSLSCVDFITGKTISLSLPDRRIRQAIVVQSGELLVATDKGILKVTVEKDTSLLSEEFEEFGHHDIMGIVSDRRKNIWIASRGNGLYKLSPSLRDIKHFAAAEGIVYDDFIAGCNGLVGDNIVIGTGHGLLVFDPQKTPGPLLNPRVKIVSLLVNDVEAPSPDIDGVVQLDWNQNTVAVEFSSMSFMYQSQVKFFYQLEGHDKKWIPAKSRERIKFTNLAPGAYTLRVRCNALGSDVVTDESRVSFFIATPFWKTLWFKIAVALFGALAVAFALNRRIEKERRIQEIKNRISRDLHDHIGSSLSAINIMLSVLEGVLSSNPQKSKEILKKISTESHLTQENLHDIVWSMNMRNNTVKHLADRMREFTGSLFHDDTVNASLVVDEQLMDLELPLDKRYDLYLIFKELMNNCAKYASATSVSVKLSGENRNIVLRYADNGKGFDLVHHRNGNGLVNMQQRAKSMKGTIDIYSAPGAGMQVTLLFPI